MTRTTTRAGVRRQPRAAGVAARVPAARRRAGPRHAQGEAEEAPRRARGLAAAPARLPATPLICRRPPGPWEVLLWSGLTSIGVVGVRRTPCRNGSAAVQTAATHPAGDGAGAIPEATPEATSEATSGRAMPRCAAGGPAGRHGGGQGGAGLSGGGGAGMVAVGVAAAAVHDAGRCCRHRD
jgi:hypothetical protein